MIPGGADLHTVYLKPGEIYLGDCPSVVVTVLGSCVSVTLFSRRLGIGAICHAMLPSGECDAGGFRYLDCSMRYILEQYRLRGVRPGDLEAKVFGGADVLAIRQPDGRKETVGRKNVEKALEIIRAHGIYLAASSVGGDAGRKILFYTHTGEVLLKHQKRLGK